MCRVTNTWSNVENGGEVWWNHIFSVAVFTVLSVGGFEVVMRVLCHPDTVQGFKSQIQFGVL